MSDGADRREARRFTMSLPMRVLPREDKGREVDASTRDVSYRGLYFLADTNFEIGVSKKIQPAVTDIPRARVQFAAFSLPRQYAHRKAHRESPRFAAFRSITHQNPLGLLDSAQS